jgi:acetoin utilization deacetylase AcuC-like enzyme
MLRELLQREDFFLVEPADLASREAVLRVHGRGYVDGFLDGTLDKQLMRRIGFPWSVRLVTQTLASAGATLGATQLAIKTGFGGTLAGGTHHAFRDEGAGFCVFNDLAIAIEWARAECGIERAAIVDLDVHQGDGTASIFAGDPGVFTLSIHGARNFPFRKQKSSLDVELPDGANDRSYLAVLEPALAEVWKFSPQLLLYQAGVDGLHSDRLGRLALTLHGLRERDLAVIGGAHSRQIPVVITIGGGYSNPIENTVRASAQTFLTAAQIYL